ncbi:MAG TPA: 1,4-alpha-glucan branching protein GlgB [Gemmatimonadales bacterium]|nr:1,4-alpha-glucan branching protein GlgB [Gemmatimonadales bacterium]
MRFDADAFQAGGHDALDRWLGAHPDPSGGYRFAVWAPRARSVRVVGEWNRRGFALRPGSDGVWRGRGSRARRGQQYRLQIETRRGRVLDKADPFAVLRLDPARPDAVLWDLDFRWRDGSWMRRREPNGPMSVYEVHLGSWRRGPGGEWLGYRELGRLLAEYAGEHGFTHVQLLPVAEHPFYGSWGYQGTGYFAATARYGTPQDLMSLVDTLHRAGIGVILDWVPSHFATDAHGLARFDGSALFEHPDRRLGFHPDWRSCVFDYSKGEVRSFLLSSARFWLEHFHVDGLRVDAVASMLYLDFSRRAGEWVPNRYGGNENVDAFGLLRSVNDMVHLRHPGTVTIAEESSAWPGVTRPTDLGGVGFDLKWDMGWMHDTLGYLRRPPAERRHHKRELTFRMMYAWAERFMLALSHDEVVHGKASLVGKMPGTDPQRFANLRLLFGYQWALPGPKLVFMGGEIAQWREWDHEGEVEWGLLRWRPHRGMQRWVADLNRLLAAEPALHRRDFEPGGFEWIDADDPSVAAFVRHGGEGDRPVVFLANLSDRRRRYRLGVPVGGRWQTLLDSDDARYGGGGHPRGRLAAQPKRAHGRAQSLAVDLPPLTARFLAPVGRSQPSRRG